MELSKRTVLAAAIAAAMPCQVYALAISSGSTVNIGNTANAVVQVSETEAARSCRSSLTTGAKTLTF